MNAPWGSWRFWKGAVFVFSASTSIVLTYLRHDGTGLLEFIWRPLWDVKALDYGDDVIVPFYAGISAVAFLSPLFTEPSQKGENERAFDFGLGLWSGVAAFINAGYWLSHATNEKAILHLAALSPLILIVGLLLAIYFGIMALRQDRPQDRMSQSRGINGEGQELPERELRPTMEATDRVNFLFADARSLYDDALEMLTQEKIRNAAEKAWGATKRATDALVLARHGEEPQSAGQARRALLRLSAQDPAFDAFQGQYNTRSALLHVNCFYDGNCEPVEEMASLIRATISYIQTAEELSSRA